jgi:tRNA 2-selenouridine synthase SelU
LSKQLLSQIHFCRFLYKLVVRMRDRLGQETNEELSPLKELMAGLIFEKLDEVNTLRAVNSKHAPDYKATPDYHKIAQIIDQYVAKYTKDLSSISRTLKPLATFKEQLTKSILGIYERVQGE